MKLRKAFLAVALLVFVAPVAAAESEQGPTIRIGSKVFTESVILGEMIKHLAASTGQRAFHQRELGGTRVLWSALLAGEIDIYPEYTGTLTQEILAREGLRSEADLHRALAERGLRMTPPLGFGLRRRGGARRPALCVPARRP